MNIIDTRIAIAPLIYRIATILAIVPQTLPLLITDLVRGVASISRFLERR